MRHVSSALVSAGGAREAEVHYRAAMKALFDDQADCHRHKQCHRSKKTGRNKWTMMEMWAMLVPALTTVVSLDYSKLVSSGYIVVQCLVDHMYKSCTCSVVWISSHMASTAAQEHTLYMVAKPSAHMQALYARRLVTKSVMDAVLAHPLVLPEPAYDTLYGPVQIDMPD